MRPALQRPPAGSAVNCATTERCGRASVVRSFGGFALFFSIVEWARSARAAARTTIDDILDA